MPALFKVNKCTTVYEPVYEGEELVEMAIVDSDNEPMDIDTFQDLLDLLKYCAFRSDSGEPSDWTWVYEAPDENFTTGGYKENTFHFNGLDQHIKYWRKAIDYLKI